MPIYGLRFRALGQTLYHTGPADLAVGDHVLIAADQGQALALVVSGPYDYVAGVEPESLTPIERRKKTWPRAVPTRNWPARPRSSAASASVTAAWT